MGKLLLLKSFVFSRDVVLLCHISLLEFIHPVWMWISTRACVGLNGKINQPANNWFFLSSFLFVLFLLYTKTGKVVLFPFRKSLFETSIVDLYSHSFRNKFFGVLFLDPSLTHFRCFFASLPALSRKQLFNFTTPPLSAFLELFLFHFFAQVQKQ